MHRNSVGPLATASRFQAAPLLQSCVRVLWKKTQQRRWIILNNRVTDAEMLCRLWALRRGRRARWILQDEANQKPCFFVASQESNSVEQKVKISHRVYIFSRWSLIVQHPCLSCRWSASESPPSNNELLTCSERQSAPGSPREITAVVIVSTAWWLWLHEAVFLFPQIHFTWRQNCATVLSYTPWMSRNFFSFVWSMVSPAFTNLHSKYIEVMNITSVYTVIVWTLLPWMEYNLLLNESDMATVTLVLILTLEIDSIELHVGWLGDLTFSIVLINVSELSYLCLGVGWLTPLPHSKKVPGWTTGMNFFFCNSLCIAFKTTMRT